MKNFDNFISDEMLAAYIDGNAIPIEKNMIEEYIDCDDLQEIMEIVSDIKTSTELVESVETKGIEIPEHLFEGLDNPLQEIKKEIEGTDKYII